ncbi:MAG: cation transporter [Desulfobacterales bacterium GWB2_56_26]|nr:MAG: cation transporter [Desulfobacterales bacterium GWB2_56_26]
MEQSDPAKLAKTAWHSLTAAEALQLLGTSEVGLSGDEANRRLEAHGPNVLRRQAVEGPLKLLWRQIDNPLIWVLIGSAVLAVLLGKITDGAVVLAVVVINTIIGFIQEYRAGKAIEALAGMVPETVAVVRAGKREDLPVADLVPGDVVLLASGDRVPADVRLVTVRNLQIDEAALTGESVPVAKSGHPTGKDADLGDRSCMGYSGTLVTYGTGTAVVVATGNDTELGRISTLLGEVVDLQTPLTKALASIGKVITVGVLLVSLVMLVVGMLRMTGQGVTPWLAFRDTLIFAIALAVGAIPEGLPAIVTIALAIGVQRMASRRAIIRKLPAVETLGSTSTICTDKTGTLTRNEMTVQALWTPAGEFELTGVGYSPAGALRQDEKELDEVPDAVRELVLCGALCNDAAVFREGDEWKLSGDPTEGALVTSALKCRVDVEAVRGEGRVDAVPFESEHQFMATLHMESGDSRRIIAKGAPEAVLARCGEGVDATAVSGAVEQLTASGMRVLAVAAKSVDQPLESLAMEDVQGLTLLGLQGMIDPPRPEAVAAVEACHAAGITVKMITGDHKGTAAAIGRQLGLASERAVSGAEIEATAEGELQALAGRNNVFARVAPEHKLRLVRALQAGGQVVAMTGDGVNDAPALKQANIGVAMGITGTAVSKESADIVLTDDNFASIVAAVEEGRRVYDNLIKSLTFVLPTNLGLALILIYAVGFFPFDSGKMQLLLPMLPVQLLWINLVAAVSLALPFAFEAKEPDVMRRPPRSPQEPVFTGFVIFRTVVAALLMAVGAIGLFQYEYSRELAMGIPADRAMAEAQTMAVTTVIMFQIFYMQSCRSLKGSIFQMGLFSNPAVFIGVATVLLLQSAFIFLPILNRIFGSSPLALLDLGLAALVGAVVLPIVAVEKLWRNRIAGNAKDDQPDRA